LLDKSQEGKILGKGNENKKLKTNPKVHLLFEDARMW
jgi:hypothetical protein